MPSSHRRYADWTPDRFRRWAASVGPQTEGLIIAILAHRPHPEQGFRTCLGVLRLFRDLEAARAEAVSARALQIGALTYKSIASILANRLAANPPATRARPPSSSTPTCAAPATSIEENHHADPSHPRPAAPTSACTAWPRASRISQAQPEARALEHAEWLALLLEREATLRRQKRFESRARAARLRHDARSRTSTSAPPAASTAGSSSSSPAATGSASGTGSC